MAFYTVDRRRALVAGQKISLVKYKDVQPPELQQHVEKFFPDGVTSHGERYLLRGETRTILLNPNIELLLEYVRRSHYADKPSRFQSLFAWETVAAAKEFRSSISFQ